MTISDWVQLSGILVSLVVGLIAIWISIKTLRQSSQMIEDATRPYVTVYSKYTNGVFYIVIKNFGSSMAIIDAIKTDFFISSSGNFVQGNPFENLINASLAPGKSKLCPLLSYKLDTRKFKFHIKYHSQTKTYIEDYLIDGDADNAFPDTHSSVNTVEQGIKNIAHTLQDILKTKL